MSHTAWSDGLNPQCEQTCLDVLHTLALEKFIQVHPPTGRAQVVFGTATTSLQQGMQGFPRTHHSPESKAPGMVAM